MVHLTADFCHWVINLPQLIMKRTRDARLSQAALGTDKTGFLGPDTHTNEYKKSQDPQSLARVDPLLSRPSIRELVLARRPFVQFARRMSRLLQNS